MSTDLTAAEAMDISVVVTSIKGRDENGNYEITVADGFDHYDQIILIIDVEFEDEYYNIKRRFNAGEVILLHLKCIAKQIFTNSREENSISKLQTQQSTIWAKLSQDARIKLLTEVYKHYVKKVEDIFQVRGKFTAKNSEERPYKYTCGVCGDHHVIIISLKDRTGDCAACKTQCEILSVPWIEGVIVDDVTGKEYTVQAKDGWFKYLTGLNPDTVIEEYDNRNIRDTLLEEIENISTKGIFKFNSFGEFAGFDEIFD